MMTSTHAVIARVLVVILTGAAVSPPIASAQDPRLEYRLDVPTRVAIEQLIDSVRLAGLPTEPLASKALEGASKGAAGDRILAAVRRLAGQLALSRGALGAGATDAEVEAGAAALTAGAGPPDLQRLRAARPRQSLVVPLGALADLVARGVPVDSARRVVVVLAAEHLRDEDFVTFRRNVERDIALGAPPAAAASVRLTEAVRAAALFDALTGLPPTQPVPRRKP